MFHQRTTTKIRLGLLGTDTHGCYYGCLLSPSDPVVLAELDWVVHYYFTDRFVAHRFTRPLVPGFEIVKVWDPAPDRAARFAKLFFGKPVPCTRLDEMTEGVDAVFIADCNGGGQEHLKLATPFLKKGIPTFVDKPFASTLADARAMVALARKHKTPLMNASILSHVPAADQFKRRFPEIGHVGMGVLRGVVGGWGLKPGEIGTLEDYLAAGIHGIALGMNLFGKDVEWVEAMGLRPLEYLHLHLKSGVEVLILNASIEIFNDRNDYYAMAYSKLGQLHAPPIGDPEFVAGAARIVRLFKRMILTGKPPIPYDDMLKQIAIVEACQAAQKTGKRVFIRDVLKRRKRAE